MQKPFSIRGGAVLGSHECENAQKQLWGGKGAATISSGDLEGRTYYLNM